MFRHLMREPVPIRRLVGTSPTGGKTYDPPKAEDPDIILGRLEWQRRKVINSQGEEAISEAVLYTAERMKPGDLVIVDGREWPVVAISERKSLYGGTDHWEVRL